MADYLFNTILLYNKPDPIGSISFFIFIILVILIVQFFKGISERKEEKKNKETERIYNEKIAFQENTRRQLGLELPRTYPNTFPVLIFVQQRQLIYANYCNDSKSNKGKSEYQFYYVLCRFFEKQNIF